MHAKERFLRYVTYYTTSDDSTGTSPSTERQKDLGRLLMKELDELGLTDIRMDAPGKGRSKRAGAGADRPHGHRAGRPW